MGFDRSSPPFAVALSCALWAVTPQARAADQGITGKKLLLKGTSKLVLLSKDPSINIMGSDPVGGSDSSITFDDGTNTATLSLPASNWSTNGSGTLFKYKNTSAPSGPSVVKIAKVKAGLLKVVAKGLPVPIPNGPGTINVILSLDGGTNAYCMTFTGTGDGAKFLVKDSAAGICPATATPTPTVDAHAHRDAHARAPGHPATRAGALALSRPGVLHREHDHQRDLRQRDQQLGSDGHAATRHLRAHRRHRDRAARDRVGARRLVLLRRQELGRRSSTKRTPSPGRATSTYRSTIASSLAAAPRAGRPSCVIAIQEAREDAQTAVRFLRTNAATYGIDETRIAIGGSSAGAITALNVGFSSSEDPTAAVGGAVSLSGAHLISGGTIDSGDAPSLLFHGTADTVVPYQWAVNTWNQANAVGLDSFLTSWAGAGHVPYVAHRTEILDQTTNFLYWELDLATAAQ